MPFFKFLPNLAFVPRRAQPGWGLIEMAAVLAILGFATWATLSALGTSDQGKARIQAQSQIDELLERLTTFAWAEDRLPTPDRNGNGLEDPPTNSSDNALEGGLPWITLGLSKADARDPWGRPLVYAVTRSATVIGALADRQSWPEGKLTITSTKTAGTEQKIAALTLLLSRGQNGALTASTNGAEGENSNGDAFYTLEAGRRNGDRASFDDLLGYRTAGTLAVAAGRTPPLPTMGNSPLELPTTLAALSAQTDVTWIGRDLEGAVQDSGQTSLTIEGARLIAEGGTLAVDSTSMNRGLGVYSDAAPLTDSPALVDGGELGLDATESESPRALSILFHRPYERVSLTLSGLEGRRQVDAAWLRSNDPTKKRCLAPPNHVGSCPIHWREGARLEFWDENKVMGTLELRGCPSKSLDSSSRFTNLSQNGQVFTLLRLVPLPVVDQSNRVIPGEGSFFRLGSLTASTCEDSCPEPPSPLTDCP
ncbi:type II secretion system protein [Rhodospirillum sp. A1_3_36]|uniref:type II secretion system protein n=1 Tax=Rhodospirillum sp. A1_3_36 TaxID=3391666 RepID=UPI0039A5EA73